MHNNHISVFVVPDDGTWNSTMQYFDHSIEWHTNMPEIYENFLVISSSNVTIGNTTGQQLIYSYESKAYEHDWDPIDEYLYKYPVLCRDVCFMTDGLFWSIEMGSSPNASEEANAVYNHILETLTFLD
jgi:hypothetical protein